MKKILFTILMLVGIAYGQSTVYLRADTIKMQRTGGNANLQILNATRDSTNGVLINTGNGITSFKRIRAINDSQFTVGTDTITLAGATGASTDSSAILINANGGGYELLNFQTADTVKVKNLIAGDNVTLDSTATGITINSTGGNNFANADLTSTGNRSHNFIDHFLGITASSNNGYSFMFMDGSNFQLQYFDDATTSLSEIIFDNASSKPNIQIFSQDDASAFPQTGHMAAVWQDSIILRSKRNSDTTNIYLGALMPASVAVSGLGIDANGRVVTSSLLSLAAIGSSPNANGATISGTTLNLEPASASFGGVVTTGTQTFAGAKTFNSDITIGTITAGYGGGAVNTNTVFGYQAFNSNAAAGSAYNIAIGFQALYGSNNATADYNYAIGEQTMYNVTTGNRNQAFGYQALRKITTGTNNIAIGLGSMGNSAGNMTGLYNVGIGTAALEKVEGGSYNMAIGANTLSFNVSGNRNVAIGYQAGYFSTGDSSVYLGYQAGYNNTSSASLFIDNTSSTTPLIHGDFRSDSLRFNAAVSIRDVDSTSSPMNMLFITKEGRIKKAAVPSGGGGSYTFDYGLSESGGTVKVDTSDIATKAYVDQQIDLVSVGSGISGSDVPDYIRNNTFKIVEALGGDTKFTALNGDRHQIAGSQLLADGTVRWVAVYITETTTITGVRWYQTVQGAYTADNYNGVGLYSYSGGTMTLEASSTDDGNIWKGAAGWQTKAFSSTYNASPGVYYIAMLYNQSSQTTQPAIGRFALLNALGMASGGGMTNSAMLNPLETSQTSLPATQAMSDAANDTAIPYAELY